MMRWLDLFRRNAKLDVPLDAVRYVVLDTEFTSLDRRTNRLLSVGAIAMQGPSIRLGEQFYRVVNPGVPVPEAAILIHKLRPSDVAAGRPTAEVLDELSEFIDGAVLVGHFLGIDLELLRKEMRVTGHKLPHTAICTMRVQQWILRNSRYAEDLGHKLDQLDLATVAKSYALQSQDAHHALDDAWLTARLWQRMLPKLESMNIQDLGRLEKIGRAK